MSDKIIILTDDHGNTCWWEGPGLYVAPLDHPNSNTSSAYRYADMEEYNSGEVDTHHLPGAARVLMTPEDFLRW